MNNHLVLVPLWKRPAFAMACLKRLTYATRRYAERAPHGKNLYFRLLLDTAFDPKVKKAARDFAAQDGIYAEMVVRKFRKMRGNSHNVLTALVTAAGGDWDLVHIVEEDVFVSDGYFTFHDQAHALGGANVFSVSAVTNHNDRTGHERFGGDMSAVWEHASYQSLGVSLRMNAVRMVVPHVTDAYFKNPAGYCKQTFPRSVIAPGHTEQDGLINRLRERSGMVTLYPVVPRAYHAGFTGYNRVSKARVSGTVREQAEKILAMDSQRLNSLASAIYRDHEVSDLSLNFPVARVLR